MIVTLEASFSAQGENVGELETSIASDESS